MKYEIELCKIEDVKPYIKNAKKHPQEQIELIKNSISEFGFKQNLVIDENGVIIMGHGRYEAAKQLGIKELPCLRVNDLSDEQIKALRLADNKVAESEWDIDLLNIELDDIFDLDMSEFGFDLDFGDDNAGGQRNEASYDEDISVVIECENDQEAEKIFNELTELGYTCKISTL